MKPGRSHPLISTALLETDARSGALLLVLWIVREGRPNGTVTYTLIDSMRGDEDYQLDSHLDPGAEVEIHGFGRAGADGRRPVEAGWPFMTRENRPYQRERS
ncbi:MAG: hypothetical protein WKF75_15415 [Singulisphaera sp.]